MDRPEVDSTEFTLIPSSPYDITTTSQTMTKGKLKYICRLYKIFGFVGVNLRG